MPRLFEDPFDLGDISFNTGTVDTDGNRWYCDGLEGWDEAVEPRVQVEAFGYSDGVVAAQRFPLSARYIEMHGVVVSPSRQVAIHALRKLHEQLSPNNTIDAIRYGPFQERMEVRRAGVVQKTMDHGEAFRFQTTLLAPWPFKTSTVERVITAGMFTGTEYYRVYPRVFPMRYTLLLEGSEAGGLPTTATVRNDGNAYAYPKFEVRGPLLAGEWYIINDATGETMSFTLDISSGSVLYIDTRKQTAILNGAPVEYFIRGDWLNMPPREVSPFRLVSATSVTGVQLLVRSYDTWL